MQIQEIQSMLASICQDCAENELSAIVLDFVENIEGGFIPLCNVFLSGYAGLGKTRAVEVIAKILARYGVQLVQVPIACNASVFSKLVIDNLDVNSPCLFFIDEMHTLPIQARNLLKLITETGGQIKEIPVQMGKEEFRVTVNPAIHWFIGASNEAVKDTALVGASGRFKTLQFFPYNEERKASIFAAMLPHYGQGLELTPEMQALCLRNVRPFARSIKNLIQALRMRQRLGNQITDEKAVQKALKESGYLKGGWQAQHLAILLFMDKAPRQVQEIQQGPLKGADLATAQAYLSELMQESYVRTDNGKKIITREGQAFLASFKKSK